MRRCSRRPRRGQRRQGHYEIHGNTIEHLHLHVFPRYTGDPFDGQPIDGSSSAFHRSPHDWRGLPDRSATRCAADARPLPLPNVNWDFNARNGPSASARGRYPARSRCGNAVVRGGCCSTAKRVGYV